MKRIDKISLLKQVLAGNIIRLEHLQAQRGRLYTNEERATQREFLSSLFRREATVDEVTRMFGHYDQSEVMGSEAFKLPNGIILFF
jgi:hypothetical protein